ncbi:MAG: DUF2764 domain-containing protein [Prevotellaceae bacterium]|jgi:hypothetical protein|nr:DUF2764 domain-containing protein [Prevotellaceae bacterium]
MAQNYYHLTASLPELTFKPDSPAQVDVLEIRDSILEEVSSSDAIHVHETLSGIDNYNLLTQIFVKKRAWKRGGMLEADTAKETLPQYMQQFIDQMEQYEREHGTKPDELQATQQLYELCHTAMEASKSPFVARWHKIEREIRNIQAAYFCRKSNIAADNHLIASDEMRESLLKSQAQDFGLSKEYDYVAELVRIFEIADMLDREKRLDMFRWNIIDEINAFEYFTVDAALGVLQKACIIDRWTQMNSNDGEQHFRNIVKTLTEVSSD